MAKASATRCFADAFTKARERKGLSVPQVAAAAGVDKVTIYRAVENNGASLHIETLEKLCSAVALDPRRCWKWTPAT